MNPVIMLLNEIEDINHIWFSKYSIGKNPSYEMLPTESLIAKFWIVANYNLVCIIPCWHLSWKMAPRVVLHHLMFKSSFRSTVIERFHAQCPSARTRRRSPEFALGYRQRSL